jgi:hypothetical protein
LIARRKAFFALGWLAFFAAALLLSACSSEPTERKAFIAFLQNKVLNKPGMRIPLLNEKTRSELGSYAEHYELITRYNQEIAEQDVVQAMRSLQNANTLPKLIAQREKLEKLQAQIPEAIKGMKEQLDAVKAKKQALNQPEDLQKVYDLAFERLVTKQGDLLLEMMAASHSMVTGAVNLIKLTAENPREFTTVGGNLQTTNPRMLSKVNDIAAKMEADIATINRVQRDVQNLNN